MGEEEEESACPSSSPPPPARADAPSLCSGANPWWGQGGGQDARPAPCPVLLSSKDLCGELARDPWIE